MSEFKEFCQKAKLKPPFVLEKTGNYILDSNNVVVIQIRGYGHFQYLKNGELLQDSFAKHVIDAINKEFPR